VSPRCLWMHPREPIPCAEEVDFVRTRGPRHRPQRVHTPKFFVGAITSIQRSNGCTQNWCQQSSLTVKGLHDVAKYTFPLCRKPKV